MHEYHIVEKIVKDALAGTKVKEISEIFATVSEASGLDPGSIELYFNDIIRQEALLKDAKLSLRLVKVKLHCPECNFDFERMNKSFSCPKCAGQARRCATNKDISIEKVVFKS